MKPIKILGILSGLVCGILLARAVFSFVSMIKDLSGSTHFSLDIISFSFGGIFLFIYIFGGYYYSNKIDSKKLSGIDKCVIGLLLLLVIGYLSLEYYDYYAVRQGEKTVKKNAQIIKLYSEIQEEYHRLLFKGHPIITSVFLERVKDRFDITLTFDGRLSGNYIVDWSIKDSLYNKDFYVKRETIFLDNGVCTKIINLEILELLKHYTESLLNTPVSEVKIGMDAEFCFVFNLTPKITEQKKEAVLNHLSKIYGYDTFPSSLDNTFLQQRKTFYNLTFGIDKGKYILDSYYKNNSVGTDAVDLR